MSRGGRKRPSPSLDSLYALQLELLQEHRRAVADAAVRRKRIEITLARLESRIEELVQQLEALDAEGASDSAQYQEWALQLRERLAVLEPEADDARRQFNELNSEESRMTVDAQHFGMRVEVLRSFMERIAVDRSAVAARDTTVGPPHGEPDKPADEYALFELDTRVEGTVVK